MGTNKRSYSERSITLPCRLYKNGQVLCPGNPAVCRGPSCPVYSSYIADDLNIKERDELFQSWYAIPQQPRFCADLWYHRILLLKPEAMERAGIKLKIENQLFYALGGPGCLKNNPVGEIDGHVLGSQEPRIFYRNDFYGIANERALKRYKEVVDLIVLSFS